MVSAVSMQVTERVENTQLCLRHKPETYSYYVFIQLTKDSILRNAGLTAIFFIAHMLM